MDKQTTNSGKLNDLIDESNTNIDIFQNTDSFVLHTKERVPYIDSYENKQLENGAALLLQGKNSVVFYLLIEGDSNINRTEFDLKKTFRENITNNKISKDDVEK